MADFNDLESLYFAAVEKSPDERPGFLDVACQGNQELRASVERLLAAQPKVGGFLDPHAAIEGQSPKEETATIGIDTPATAIFPGKNEHVGAVFGGKYKLLEQIGEGGMGDVWLAQQIEPVKRQVAVKLIKPGMDSKQVLARFEAERQALAMMDHPNIAKVLDGGLNENRPYFVMELVKGVPITEYCDHHKLTPKQRLELFVPVCQAIQHAHQKGVIHRDIKPSNVLIAMYDDRPVPKVIDFGVAKATGATLTEHTINTGFGGIVGTPQYMSPEQATFNNLDIDTRSDVYSLGVLLYEMLAGSPPFSGAELQRKGVLEMLRVVREDEPPKPSTKLSTADAVASLSANRGTEPKTLTGILRNELDWIVMKSLEKDRSRRYETANGFAADVNRYLAGETVQAHPPSTRYRLKKWVRRNKSLVTAATIIWLITLAQVGFSTLQWKKASNSHRMAVASEEKALLTLVNMTTERDAKEQARAEEAVQRKQAVEFLGQALDTLRATTGTDVEQLIGGKTELGANEKAYLDAIAKRWQAFAKQVGTDEQTLAIRSEGHFRVAGLWHKLDRREEACSEYRLARDLRKSLVVQFSAVREHQFELSLTHLNLGILLAELGHPIEGITEIQAALNLVTALVKQDPDSPKYQSQLAINRFNLGGIFALQGDPNKAVLELIAAHDVQSKLVEQFPQEIEYQRQLAHTCSNLGVILVRCLKRDEAVLLYREASRLQKKLADKFPKVIEYQEAIADTHNSLGIVLSELGRHDEARPEYMSSRDTRKKLAEQFPAIPRYQIDLGGSYCNFGNLIRNEGNAAESLVWLDRAVQTLQVVREREPLDSKAKVYLRNSHIGRAQTNDQLKKFVEAAADWDRAVELSSPAEQSGFRASRTTSRLQSGQVAEAVAEVAELTKSSNWSAGQWYDFACVCAVASGKIVDKKQEYADRAMEFLQKAVKAGYKDAAHMKKDADLVLLHGREDFMKMIAELELKNSPMLEKP